jgi:ATP-dependent RNA helicase DeaD
LLKTIERVIGARIQRRELPTVAELEEHAQAALVAQVDQVLVEGEWRAFRPLVEDLVQWHDPLDLAAPYRRRRKPR